MGTWVHNALEPVYEWLNALPGIGQEIGPPDSSDALTIHANRDYYQYTTSFNGTSGTGSGLLSARPATCTAGPGGTFGAGPPEFGGSPGVAYWATDNNTLYVCTATNTWTAYYTPYTYPHPLVTGGTQASGNPNPPTNLQVKVQ
jgi:hypothetical protein